MELSIELAEIQNAIKRTIPKRGRRFTRSNHANTQYTRVVNIQSQDCLSGVSSRLS